MKWFRKAAEQNDPEAQYNLGSSYLEGKGVAKDEFEAVKWFRKAAVQDDPEAQNALGFCFSSGRGVPKDYVQSYKWISLAANQGDQTAQRNLILLSAGMTTEQIDEGRKLAREFKPRVE